MLKNGINNILFCTTILLMIQNAPKIETIHNSKEIIISYFAILNPIVPLHLSDQIIFEKK